MARRIRFVAGDDKKRLWPSLAAYQVYYCYVAGQLVLCRRSRIAVWQVGFSGEDLRHYLLYSSDFRRWSLAKNRTCDTRGGDLRRRSGRPATPYALQQRFPSPVPSKESDLRRRSGRPATLCVSPPFSHSPFLRSRTPLPSRSQCPAAPAPRRPSLPLPHPAPTPRLPAPASPPPSSRPPLPAAPRPTSPAPVPPHPPDALPKPYAIL